MAKSRKTISKKTRFEVFKRDSFTCQYCGASAPTVVLHVDHIQPVSKAGADDILNYVTACFDCNMGKKDRLLSDDSVVQKQKAQLDELQERREQLEMMLQWRQGLTNLEDVALDAAETEWERLTGWGVNEVGISELKKLLRKWGLHPVLEAMGKASVYLEVIKGDRCTSESFNLAFNKIGGICRMASLPEWKQEIYHIRNIARKRANGSHWQPQTSAMLLNHLTAAYDAGVSVDDLRKTALRGLNFNQLWDAITSQMEGICG